MRRFGILTLVVASACGPPRFDGKTAAEWADALENAETGEAALASLAHVDAVPFLAEIVRGDRTQARLMAIQVISRLGPDAVEAVPALTEAVESTEVAVRAYAALALGRIGKDARPALVALDGALDDPHARVRIAAGLAMWGIARDFETAKTALFGGLASANPRVREMAAEAFGELGDAGIALLIIALADKDERVRAAAARTLGRVRATRARPALEEAIRDESRDVRDAAREALAALDAG